MSSSATGKEVGEAMMVDVDCGSTSTVAESVMLEAGQASEAGAPALTMADSRVRCVAVSMRLVCCRWASAAVSESPHGRATRLPVPMARTRAAESWVTSSGVLVGGDDAVALAEGEGGAEDFGDGPAFAEGSAVDGDDESPP